MSLFQALGTQLFYSAALAATHDQAGMEALTFLKVGRLNGAPDLDGERDIATFDDLETGEETKFADMFRAGSSNFQVGMDDDDTGQNAMSTALASGDKGVIKVVLKSGKTYYRNCIVKKFSPTGVQTGGVVRRDTTLEFEKTSVVV